MREGREGGERGRGMKEVGKRVLNSDVYFNRYYHYVFTSVMVSV